MEQLFHVTSAYSGGRATDATDSLTTAYSAAARTLNCGQIVDTTISAGHREPRVQGRTLTRTPV
jgi:hypothetical protein